MASVMSRTWKAIASMQARAIWARPAPRVRPGDDAAGRRVPPGAAEAGEGGHEGDAPAVADRLGQRADLRRVVDDPEAVAQPLDGGARDEGRPLEGVGQGRLEPCPCRHAPPMLPVAPPCDPRSQATLTVRPSGAPAAPARHWPGRSCPCRR